MTERNDGTTERSPTETVKWVLWKYELKTCEKTGLGNSFLIWIFRDTVLILTHQIDCLEPLSGNNSLTCPDFVKQFLWRYSSCWNNSFEDMVHSNTWFLWNSFSEKSSCWNTIPLKKGLLGKDSGRYRYLLKRGFVEQFPWKMVSRKGFPWKRLTLKEAVNCLRGHDSTKKQTLNQVKKVGSEVSERFHWYSRQNDGMV